jgi:transposase InsO family protein
VHVRSRLAVSERRACRIIGQARSTQRRRRQVRDDEAALTSAIERLATQYGRYGYRRIRRMLVDEGWRVNVKRVWRIWRREGLKVPKKQPKRGRLWLNDGSCVRLAARAAQSRLVLRLHPGSDGGHRTFRMLCVIDEFTRRCLALWWRDDFDRTMCFSA